MGEFKNDKRHGYGREFWKSTKSIKYDGEWFEGKKCGNICEFNESGQKNFEGMYKEDLRYIFLDLLYIEMARESNFM